MSDGVGTVQNNCSIFLVYKKISHRMTEAVCLVKSILLNGSNNVQVDFQVRERRKHIDSFSTELCPSVCGLPDEYGVINYLLLALIQVYVTVMFSYSCLYFKNVYVFCLETVCRYAGLSLHLTISYEAIFLNVTF